MKKLLSLLLSITMVCALVGCSSDGVSQADYDALLAENTALKQEVDELKNALLDAEKDEAETPTPPDSDKSNSDQTDDTDKLGSRKNPLKVGETFDGVYTEYRDYQFGVTITLVEVISGEEAWKLIEAKNKFNDPPGEGKQYIMAKFSVHYHTDISGEDRPLELNTHDFSYSTSTYAIVDMVDMPSVVEPDPAFDIELYEGATGEGWVVFLADADDPSPKAVFCDSLWFNLL